MNNIKWNVVKEVGLPKDTGLYYVTYKDGPLETIKVTITGFFYECDVDDITASAFDVCEDDIIAWAKYDDALPEPYKEEDADEFSIGDFIRSSSNEDIARMIMFFITEYEIDKDKDKLEFPEFFIKAICESAYTAMFANKLEKILSETYKESTYCKVLGEAKE